MHSGLEKASASTGILVHPYGLTLYLSNVNEVALPLGGGDDETHNESVLNIVPFVK